MRSECLLQRFRPYLAPKSPSRPPEAQIEEELVVLNARPRWTVGSAIGKFTTQNPAVYHPQADKISISLPGPREPPAPGRRRAGPGPRRRGIMISTAGPDQGYFES